jgi:mono/diheme cytochrome c family protein
MKGTSPTVASRKSDGAPLRLVAIACCVALTIGCTKADPPQFVLNTEELDPVDFIASGTPDDVLEKRIADTEAELTKLQESDPESSGITRLEEQLNAYREDESRNGRAKGMADIRIALTALFGTPNEPYVLEQMRTTAESPETGFDLAKLKRAAGPVSMEEDGTQIGLFRQHCVHCHGITGDGFGPTAIFLNPYPRDFRRGIFKFTSTTESAKPTKDDLKRTLKLGIAGTAMPSFALLPEADLDALVEYVKYLSVRGEVELSLRELVRADDEVPMTHDDLLGETQSYMEMWEAANSEVIIPEAPPTLDEAGLLASIEAGRVLFQDAKAQCVQCHGPTALGDGAEKRFDVWNEAKNEENIAFFNLPKQALQPRNLRSGVYRGGRRPLDLYRRLQAGIKGAQMPSMGQTPAKPSGLTPEEIWNLVHYVQSLPYDPMSENAAERPSVQRNLN